MIKKHSLVILVIAIVFGHTLIQGAVINSYESPEDKERLQFLLERLRKRNPFPAGSAVSDINLIVEGIIWDKENPIAVINGKFVSVGDFVEGNEIVEIQKTRVLIKKPGWKKPIAVNVATE